MTKKCFIKKPTKKIFNICKYSKDKQRIDSPTCYVLGKPIIPITDVKRSIDLKLFCEFSKTKRVFLGKVRKFNDNKSKLDFSNTTYISSMADIHPDECQIIDTQYFFLKPETMKQGSTWIVFSNFEYKIILFWNWRFDICSYWWLFSRKDCCYSKQI